MVDEEKPVEDGEAKEPKKVGRPSKRTAAKPEQPEPAADEQREDTAPEDGEKESAEEDAPAEKVDDESSEEGFVDDSTAPDGRVVREGEEYEINTRDENGVKVAAENTYLKRRLLNSKRYTYILLAVEGSPQ